MIPDALPALEMEEGARSQGMQVDCRSWKREEKASALETLGGTQPLETLILVP